MTNEPTTCQYCGRQGWPTLDGLCHVHFRDLVCFSLRHGADRAEREWADAIDRVYRVECALGLRIKPSEFTAEDTPLAIEEQRREERATITRRVPSRPKLDDSEDFV